MENKSNKGLIITIVILVICVLGMGGYLVYDKVLSEKDVQVDIVKDNNSKEENNSSKDKNENKDELTMSQEEIENLGKSLFDKTNLNDRGISYFYGGVHNGIYNYNLMDNKTRLEIVWSLIPDEEFTISEYELNNNYPESCNTEYGLSCFARKVSKDVFEKYYHEIFGMNKNVNYEEFTSENGPVNCKIENNEIVSYIFWGGDTIYSKKYLYYEKSELNENNLVVSVSFLAFNMSDFSLYSDYDLTKIIVNNVDGELDQEQLYSQYHNSASKYKLTFNKDTNDNWYWVSTELVK